MAWCFGLGLETLMAGKHVYRRQPQQNAWWQRWHAIKHQVFNWIRNADEEFEELRKDYLKWMER
jgi:hypothetical protein